MVVIFKATFFKNQVKRGRGKYDKNLVFRMEKCHE